MNSQDKKKFRASREWKAFRQRLLSERGPICELCGTRYSGKRKRYLQVHHLDPDNYTNLDPKRFVLICSSDHEMIERISRKIMSKNTELRNKKLWLMLLNKFLPIISKQTLMEELSGS